MSAGTNKSFRPGELWLDKNGIHINAHGGGVFLRWFLLLVWRTQDRCETGNAAHVGIHIYSSHDLSKWK